MTPLPLRCVYVSYDGALDPLGASQVVPYLDGLSAAGVALTLVSFEKRERWQAAADRTALQARLDAAGIRWVPLRYHHRPRLPATLADVLRGARVLRRQVAAAQATLVHCRGEVAMAMARAAHLPGHVRLLYDVRAFFADERVASGSWAAGGVVDRLVRRVEAANLRRADGLVVLTEGARRMLAARRAPLPPLAVIPTCVDLDAFQPRPAGEPAAFGLAYSGSLGASYLAEDMVAFARAAAAHLPGRMLVLTPQPALARAAGADAGLAEVLALAPAAVPGHLRRATALVFFRRPSPANIASCPTKLAEALACGMPLVCNPGIDDLDALLPRERVGVIVEELSAPAYSRAAAALAELLRDPDLPARCRRLAEERFGLPAGVAAYHRLYRELAARSAG